MGRTVRELLGALDSHELTEWMAFDLVEPLGGRRGDYQAAVVASTVANVFRGKNKPVLEVTDFVPDYGAGLDGAKAQTDLAGLAGMFQHMVAAGLATEVGISDESGPTAASGDDPDADREPERLRGAERDVAEHGDGLGGSDAPDRPDA